MQMHQLSINRVIQRQRAYGLLGTIFAEGITPEVHVLCKTIPPIESLLPEVYNADLASADHQDLFGFNVLPFAGVYLAEDGKLGGLIHHRLNTWYEAMGFEPGRLRMPPDHISTQLAFLSLLSEMEVDFSSQSKRESDIQYKQASFLRSEVLAWCLPFLFSIKNQKKAIYTEVADLTLALLVSHLQELDTEIPDMDPMPEPPDILSDARAGLKQISEYLVRPVHSGVYFSKDDIKSIARALHIPTGFGDRVQLLSNVFRSAVTFDQVPALLKALKVHIEGFREEYNALAPTGGQRIGCVVEEWMKRTQKSLALLETIEQVGISPDNNDFPALDPIRATRLTE